MPVNFTDEQLNVINVRNADVLVSAAAGSGKTAVLVERIIRRILDDKERLNIDRLLVVTFTEAAAAQMRQRIGDAIKNALKNDPVNDHLQRQASLLYKAQISTIHSFCLNIIRNNFDRIGLDPAFSIGDETELKMMSEDVLDDLFERKYEEDDAGFADCVSYFCNTADDKPLRSLVLKLASVCEGAPWPLRWLDDQKDPGRGYLDHLMNNTALKLKEAKDQAGKALAIVNSPMGPSGYERNILEDISLIDELMMLDDYDRIHDFYTANKGLSKLSPKAGTEVSDELKEKVKKIREKYKNIIFGTGPGCIRRYFERDLKSEEELNAKTAPYIGALIDLTKEYLEAFGKAKTDKGIISFSDMEHYALDILYTEDADGNMIPSETSLAYKDAFDEILMDEYQDCNRVQELLISAVSSDSLGRHNRFMVGDIKQSIYKFRLASPELFLEKYKSYEMYDPKSQENGPHLRIDLHNNFRSRRSVINTVNDLFGQIMHEDLGGVEYDETAVLNYSAPFPEKNEGQDEKEGSGFDTEILLADKNNMRKDETALLEARMIASKIRKLKNELRVYDEDSETKDRPLMYKDIVILLRSIGDIAGALRKVLASEGIPCYLSLKTGFYDAGEIQDIIHMLKVIDNPLQEIPLFGAVTSYFGGFDDERVAYIRTNGEGPDLYRQMLSLRDSDPGINDFLLFLERYRKLAVHTPIHELIAMLVEETGYLEHIGAMAGGAQRKANVHMLISRAADYERSSYKGLFNFVRYISKIRETDADTGEADILDENADVVRIMTIHKSKGLEFPVCFLSGIHKQFNLTDMKGDLMIDIDLGLGASYIDTRRRIKTDTLKKRISVLKMRSDLIGEEQRVLYVAMTRAKEKLIITGSVDPDKFEEHISCGKPMSDALSYYDMLIPLLGKARIVTREVLDSEETDEAVSMIEKAGKLRLLTEQEGTELPEYKELKERFGRHYPYPELEGLIVKTSVSELKKAYLDFEMTDEIFKTDDTAGEIKTIRISGTDRGSAYHKVMELLDFCDTDVKSQINKFENNNRISKEWAQAVDPEKIQKFLGSDLGKRMAEALKKGTLKREQPFMLGINADRVRPEWPDGETVLLQGIIDAFFEEDGQIVLVDYKTDVIKTADELSSRYRIQLKYYAEAIERILGKKVKESILYSFCLGEAVSVDISDEQI
ncbi:MAG: helicase-exonuclease AddAB subunit AddA [Lachnospiraceae bacterium]|nr:helicase-exonuclease AddAB subunit AddA [Lachnospiraceae bacterium]